MAKDKIVSMRFLSRRTFWLSTAIALLAIVVWFLAPRSRINQESFDRVQAIVMEQAPFIYLINRNALSAISTSLRGASPVVLRPQTYWNADQLTLSAEPGRGR